MLILGLDTALANCSAALWRDGRVLAHRSLAMERGHSESLMPMVRDTMADAGVAFTALERIAVTVGPGSFTGVRVGLAAARGLALACGVPLVGVTTLAAVAFAAARASSDRRPVLAVLDAGRPDLFVQIFGPDLAERSQIAALAPEVAAAIVPDGPVLIAGNGAARLRPFLGGRGNVAFAPGSGLPDAGEVAALAATLTPQATLPRPVYVHPPYAKLPGVKAGEKAK